MDPLSIAAGAAGLAVSCGTIVKTLYDWIHDTVDVDENISSLCDEVTTLSRVLESISNTSVQVPVAVTVGIDPDNGLWGSLQTTLDDVKGTFEKLNQLLAELEKSSSFFSRGFLRKPRKQIRFSLRSKEISICKERIKSYNTAMTSALQMLNICLLIQSNSSQDSVVNLLSGLKSQLRRVESALQTRSYLSSGESSAEDNRISRNLRHFVQVAETFHSSASTIIEDRSTVWEGSILGEPLTQAQTSRIEEWIPPPLSEEDFTQQNSIADESSRGDAISGDAEGLHSDSGSDIDKDLTKRLEDLAIQNLRSGEFAKAEQFYRSVIDRGEASHRPFHYVTDMRVQLAYAVMRQGKWIEAEEIMAPIAFQKRVNDVLVYHGMHAIAMIHLRNFKLEAADRCCKRALWGKRKALGKESASCWDTLALLASICAAKNEVAEAEAHRSFIPPTYQVMTDTDALAYLDRTVARDQTASALLHTAEAGLPSCQTSSALRQDDPELISNQPSAIPPIQLTPTSQFIVSQPPTPSQNVVEPGNPRHEFSDIRPSQIIQGTCSAAISSFHQRFPLSEETTQAEVTCPTTPNLFVGIYYGTVHCAVAYSTKTSVPRDVDVITKWIDSSAYTKPTVPAVIYYDQYQNVVGWGHDVTEALDPEGCPKPGVHKVDWIKLYLEIVGNRLDPNSLPPLPPGKNAIDVSADYLLKLRLATQALLLETLGNAFLQERAQIHWCFTIPRTWGQSMKAALQTAIEQAGYLQTEHETRLSLFPQTETSVLHCLKTHLITLQQTDAFIVVDCPKGIVDLSAYEMVAEAPFTLTELTTGSQGTCGSLAVSRNFRHMLREKMEKMKLPDDHKNAGRICVTATREFENQIKPRFHDSGQKWLIDVGTETDYPEGDIKDGYMIFTNEEILSCFRPATTRILEMVSHQIYQVWNLNKFIRAVVVTGEFASSDFVFGQIKHHILARRQINVARSADALLARVKGAVMTGISRSPANPRVRTQTLGRIVQ